MASLSQQPSGNFLIHFRFAGTRFNRSLQTRDPKEAAESKSLVERTLRLIKQGEKSPPNNATADDAWQFILSGGKVTATPTVRRGISLQGGWDEYFNSMPEGAKEESSVVTERIHSRHFLRQFGASTGLQTIDAKALRHYIKQRRATGKGRRGRQIRGATIAKELQTFRQLWGFMRAEGHVNGENPVDMVEVPRDDEKPPFRTYGEIKTIVDRGGLTDVEIDELWECVFLTEEQIIELLDHVRAHSERNPADRWVYPMFAFVAFTTARRSEMLRSRREDINGSIQCREKKRKRKVRISFREIDIHPTLEQILNNWFATEHPGGHYTICKESNRPLTRDEAVAGFRRGLKGTKWKVLPGFHVFRHSFASNAARRGIPQPIIDAWMGHQTEEMRRRYQHLQRNDTKSYMLGMFPEPTNQSQAVATCED